MEIAMVGLGKMGANMLKRLLQGGHRVIALDRNEVSVRVVEASGAIGAQSPDELLTIMSAPRAVWVMVPSGDPTESVINNPAEVLGIK